MSTVLDMVTVSKSSAGYQFFMQGIYTVSTAQAVREFMRHVGVRMFSFDADVNVVRIVGGEYDGVYDVEYSLCKGELTLLQDIH